MHMYIHAFVDICRYISYTHVYVYTCRTDPHTHIDICVCKHTHIHRNPCYRSIPAHVCQQHHEHVSYHSLVDWYGMDK